MTLTERFEVKVTPEPNTGCHLWTAALNRQGYGVFQLGPKLRSEGGGTRLAHRWWYEQKVGPVPEGLDLDHLCRTPACVNPVHLEPVTRRTNLMRGNTLTRKHAEAAHCPQGHEYTPENTRRRKGKRQCAQCQRDYYHRRGKHVRRARNTEPRHADGYGKHTIALAPADRLIPYPEGQEP